MGHDTTHSSFLFSADAPLFVPTLDKDLATSETPTTLDASPSRTQSHLADAARQGVLLHDRVRVNVANGSFPSSAPTVAQVSTSAGADETQAVGTSPSRAQSHLADAARRGVFSCDQVHVTVSNGSSSLSTSADAQISTVAYADVTPALGASSFRSQSHLADAARQGVFSHDQVHVTAALGSPTLSTSAVAQASTLADSSMSSASGLSPSRAQSHLADAARQGVIGADSLDAIPLPSPGKYREPVSGCNQRALGAVDDPNDIGVQQCVARPPTPPRSPVCVLLLIKFLVLKDGRHCDSGKAISHRARKDVTFDHIFEYACAKMMLNPDNMAFLWGGTVLEPGTSPASLGMPSGSTVCLYQCAVG